MTRSSIVVIAVMALVACGKKEPAPGSAGSAAPTDDLRARCTRLVEKAVQWGSSETESTREQKIDACVGERPNAAFLDCVDRATTKEAFEKCE